MTPASPRGELAHFDALARYNRLANKRLYEACATLSDAERRADRAAFFGSIFGTLNHILVGDRIWLCRFQGGTVPSTGLDQILYHDFAELRAARGEEDRGLEAFVSELRPGFEAKTIAYVNNQGLRYEDPMDLLLLHLFNHQTHHRGQVHDMICQVAATRSDVIPPVLDMHRVLRPDPVGPGEPRA